MNKLKFLLIAIFVLVMLAGSAAAQDPALADLPAGEKFTSTDANFSVALFKDPTSIVRTEPTKEKNQRSIEYMWKMKEGLVVIESDEFLNGASFKTENDYAAFFKAFKNSVVSQEDVKVVSENPLTSGDYKGINFLLQAGKAKSLTRMIAGGNRYYTITVVSYIPANGFDAAVFKAVDTFTPTPAPKN